MDFGEARRTQRRFDFFRRIALHPVDDLFKLKTGFVRAVRFVADEEYAARLQHAVHFGKAGRQSRPEVDRLKRRGECDTVGRYGISSSE